MFRIPLYQLLVREQGRIAPKYECSPVLSNRRFH